VNPEPKRQLQEQQVSMNTVVGASENVKAVPLVAEKRYVPVMILINMCAKTKKER
jgi:hypothetical protein